MASANMDDFPVYRDLVGILTTMPHEVAWFRDYFHLSGFKNCGGGQGQTETFRAKIKLGAKATVKERPGEKVTSLKVGDRIIAYYIGPGQRYPVLDEAGKKRDVVATENRKRRI